MASGGKHLNPKPERGTPKRSGGAHLSEKSREQEEKRQENKKRLKRRVRAGSPAAIALGVLCLVMVSPLRGCILSEGDYIGRDGAREIALSDSGIVSEKAEEMSVDMIKISDRVCYKVQFKGAVTEYRYIIDAENGSIITQTFYRLDTEE